MDISTIHKNKIRFKDGPDKLCNQKEGVDTGISWKSILPLKRDEFVPPRVKTPPATFCEVEVGEALVSQNDKSGDESWLLLSSACQKGVARVLAIEENARPMIPDTVPSSKPLVN